MVVQSIPASQVVNVIPSVIPAGGSALDLNGLVLTKNVRVPIGIVAEFPTLETVQDYFGLSAAEATLAAIYFKGFDNSTQKPGAILFSQYNDAVASGWLRGGSLAAMTLDQLKALTGTVSLTVAGTLVTSTSISLSGATSFSNAATLIAAGFTSPPFAVTFDSVSSAFVFTTTATGSSATITQAGGTLSTALKLTLATGAVTSQGAAVATPTNAMSAIARTTQNWASFMTMWEPNTAGKEEFAAWTNAQGVRFLYACWSSDVLDTQAGGGSAMSVYLTATDSSGTALIYANPLVDATGQAAAFLLGAIASIDFNATNGSITLKFKSQQGLAASVTDALAAFYLDQYRVNFYGAYATANDRFVFFANGVVSGDFLWINTFVNQIWLSNQLQLAGMLVLKESKQIPYNPTGYAIIEAALQDPINQALNFGAIQPGVTLSELQISQINTAAGRPVAGTVGTKGYYLQVKDASPQVRAARGSPPINFWYTDGGSVHRITINSIDVQ